MADRAEDGRAALLVVVGAVVVLALVAGVVAWVVQGDDGPTPLERAADARLAAAAWLAAWEQDDRRALRQLAAKPGAVQPGLEAFGHDLEAVSIEAVAGRAQLELDDRATVPFDAAVDVAGLGTWRYRGVVPLVEGEDGWRVAFRASVLHPGLVEGRRLAVVTTLGPRGRLLMADGSPLPSTPAIRSIIPEVGPEVERVLTGTPSGEVRLLDGDTVVSVEASFPGAPPQDVRATLDPRIVEAATAALGTEGNPAALVAIQPSTGAVRAIANRPGNGFNRALLGRYPPGSTFKVITSVALLTHGVTPQTRIACPHEFTVNGRTISNAEDEELGDISFADAFAHSCNTAFIQLAQALPPADLEATARSFGFDADPNLGVPAETSQFPTPTGAVDLVSSAIGQGRVLVTPFQMASVAATIAASGYRPPHLFEIAPPAPLQPLPEGVAPTLQELMRRAVAAGTGRNARLSGAPVAGKTGTAEFGTDVPLHTHAWFIAFRGDLAVAVIVQDGGFGGDAAAPIAADFLRRVG